ncbi:MAG: carboxypeptidase-like regulatory domain-containing protein, partial [Ignavibacteriaceae bacterium]
MKFYVNFILGDMFFLHRLLNKKFSKIFLIAFIFLSFSVLQAQTGSIAGKVSDKSNNDPLIGANVLVIGTSTGASTDIDGQFEIKGLQAGIYKLRFSYISYRTIVVEDIEVKSAKLSTINVSLAPAAAQLDEVLITAEALKSTEASILKIQINSYNIVDGVSAELISKNNSSNGTDVLKRMTGINISEGKYAFIRGIGDRYNNTLLNGSTLPSTDPEKKSFSYDLFPASLIENVITAKTFTPDEPADFAGGLVQINTIEFPSNFIFDITTSGTYNTNTTDKSFTTYNGGKTDYLGFDDGTRDIPSIITSEKVTRGNYSNQELTAISSSFENNWGTHSVNAPFNGSFKLNIGNKYEFENKSILGFVGSLTYSNSGNTKNQEKSFYDFSGARYSYNGSSYDRTVNWGGLLNVSYKFSNTNKISFKNVYNQNADDITSFFSGDYRYAEQYREVTSLNYVSRSLLSNQLLGEHLFYILSGLNLNWNLSFSQSRRNEPDARRYVYKRNLDETVTTPLVFLADPSVDTRYFGNLTDRNFDGDIGFTLKLFDNPELPKLKFGYAYYKKDRNFNARSFGFRNTGTNRDPDFFYQPVDSIFQAENLISNILQVQEITKQSDSYTSNQYVRA